MAAGVHGLAMDCAVVSPEVTDALGDTLLAEHIARDEPELVGLSLYLWNIERSLHVARLIQERSPRTRIMVGGPEVTREPGFLHTQDGFDIAVCGEAEDRFAELLGRLQRRESLDGIAGVAQRGAGGLLDFGAEPVPDFDLRRYPSPYIQGLLPVDPTRVSYIETVRGCASKCTYCFYPRSSTSLRTLSPAEAGALVAHLHGQGAGEVSFLDPTFNHRSDLAELLAALQAANPDRRLSFFGEVRSEGLTPEIARGLAAAGFRKLELGLQSVNPQTLKVVQRYGNPDKVAAAARLLVDEGVELLVDLIIGLPNDTPDDVRRGVDFLLEHDLGGFAQVFPLSVLPGTAMRASAEMYGLVYEAAPPYRIQRTPGFAAEDLTESLFEAEEALGRRLDETPRPHLVAADGAQPRDVFVQELPGPVVAPIPAARHFALWFRAGDLFGVRAELQSALAMRLALDPFATMDLVLQPAGVPFPLDLIGLLRAQLDAAPQSYLSRALRHRGEDLQRRISVVLPSGLAVDPGWVDELMDLVPVFRDQVVDQVLRVGEELGDAEPGARILDVEVDGADWAALRCLPDPEAVVFADRGLEARWQAEVLGYGVRETVSPSRA